MLRTGIIILTALANTLTLAAPKGIRLHAATVVYPLPTSLKGPNDFAFQEPELWFNSDFIQILLRTLDPALANQIRERLTPFPQLPPQLQERVLAYSREPQVKRTSFLVIPESLRERLPKMFLNQLYTHLQRASLLPPFLGMDPKQHESFLRKFGKSPRARGALEANTFEIDGRDYVILSNPLKGYLPSGIEHFYDNEFGDRVGLRLTLTLRKGDDLRAVAEYFRGLNAPERTLEILRGALGDKREAIFPFEKLLPPGVSDWPGTFANSDGPNCFGCVLNIDAQAPRHVEVDWRDFLTESLRQRRFVRPDEPLQPGDNVAFVARGKIIHAATFVASVQRSGHETAVYLTKNGLEQTLPYLFQSFEQQQNSFIGDEGFRLVVFRKPARGEVAADPGGKAGLDDLVYYRRYSKAAVGYRATVRCYLRQLLRGD